RFGTHRHASEIGVEADASDDFSGAKAQRRAHLLPIVTVTLADCLRRSFDQSAIPLAQRLSLAHLDSSFNPSRISCAVSAPSPALRLAAEMAAAACGWP